MTEYIHHYFIGLDGIGPMTEVSLEEWCRAEQSAGFHSKFGEGHPATGGFSGHGVHGSLKVGIMKDGKEVCVNKKHPIRVCVCYGEWDKRLYIWKE